MKPRYNAKISVSVTIDANLWWHLEDLRQQTSFTTPMNRSLFYESVLRKGLAYDRVMATKKEEEQEALIKEEAKKFVEERKLKED